MQFQFILRLDVSQKYVPNMQRMNYYVHFVTCFFDTEDAAELEFTYCFFFFKCCRDDDGDHGNVKGSGMLSVFG